MTPEGLSVSVTADEIGTVVDGFAGHHGRLLAFHALVSDLERARRRERI
ncbi:MAG: hypothetical protein AAGF73_05235 [Actinomycetota bacterium]